MIGSSDRRHAGFVRAGALRGWMVALATLAGAFLAGNALAQATNAIEQVTVTRGASGRTIVKFTLRDVPANPPAGFAVANPPRIALDFLDTTSALSSNQRAVDNATLRSLNFVQAGNRTRVVFNLNSPQVFETSVVGKDVLVTLADSGAAVADQAQVQRFAEALASNGYELERTQLPFDITSEGTLTGDIGAAESNEAPRFTITLSRKLP